MVCLSCKSKKIFQIYNFKKIPLANSFSKKKNVSNKKFKLNLVVCDDCKSCQLNNVPKSDLLYKNYKHFSGASIDNIEHLRKFSVFIKNYFPKNKTLLEIGCNDGTLMNFLKNKGYFVNGIDPAKNMSNIAIHKSCNTIFKHFNNQTATELLLKSKNKGFDLIIGLNVFAHFPEVQNAFINVRNLLSKSGVFVFEVAYAVETIFSGIYDTVYHEHVFNHTLTSLMSMTKKANLKIIYASKINTQGGSLRIICKKNSSISLNFNSNSINKILAEESKIGLNKNIFYRKLKKKIIKSINKINDTVQKNINLTTDKVILLGAPARGVVVANTTVIKKIKHLNIIDDTPDKFKCFFPGLDKKLTNWSSFKNILKFDKAILLSWNYKKTIIKRLKSVGFKGNVIIFFPTIKILKI